MSPLVSRARSGSYGPQGSSDTNIARPVALLLGIAYLAGGVIGFAVTGFHGLVESNGPSIFGLQLNIFHNLVHIGIGAILLVASRLPDATMTQGILLGTAILYIAAVLLGLLGRLPIISVTSAGAGDNYLHAVSALTALFGGLAGAAQQREADAAFDA